MALLETADTLKVDRAKARELLRRYREHRSAQTPEDRAIEIAYREIARGRVIIRAYASIRAAGWNEQGLPKLALTRADVTVCECQVSANAVEFYAQRRGYHRAKIEVRDMPARPHFNQWRANATVPLIPVYLRPKSNLANYWILWEADWRRAPTDPLLLRKLVGDMWLVLAAWDLTDVERAALEQRVNT